MRKRRTAGKGSAASCRTGQGGYSADLLDCLQFSDKLLIAIKNPSFVDYAGFMSSTAAKNAVKDPEALRNNLAHGQDITSHDWPQIVRLARRIQQM